MDQCRSCHSRVDPNIKRKYADLSFASGLNTTEVLELYLDLVKQIPDQKAEFYRKISKIYAALDNAAEARRFETFAERAEAEMQNLE